MKSIVIVRAVEDDIYAALLQQSVLVVEDIQKFNFQDKRIDSFSQQIDRAAKWLDGDEARQWKIDFRLGNVDDVLERYSQNSCPKAEEVIEYLLSKNPSTFQYSNWKGELAVHHYYVFTF